ncbi:hypothetical protein OS965_26660, partial [Streptomyces sp. H27-G5]|nr:hypothetical protein [Streptomyces sp. H27-G5]
MIPSASTLAFVESPVQLLNVLEWAHARRADDGTARADDGTARPAGGRLLDGVPSQPGRSAGRAGGPSTLPGSGASGPQAPTIVVLPPTDPMSRGQLRRVARLDRDEGYTVHWQEARGGAG